jgi:hypothetical protein
MLLQFVARGAECLGNVARPSLVDAPRTKVFPQGQAVSLDSIGLLDVLSHAGGVFTDGSLFDLA